MLWLPLSTSRGTGVDETPPDMVSSSLPQLTLVPAGKGCEESLTTPSSHSVFLPFSLFLICVFTVSVPLWSAP